MDQYPVEVQALPSSEGGGFQATTPEFGRGVVGYGKTEEEAVKDLFDVLPEFLESLRLSGQEVPEP